MTDNPEKDLIIIGAGLNGLSAGLAYALNTDPQKKKVVILEKNPVSGGYVASYARQGYQFDTCQMISNVGDILDYFGLKIDFQEYGKNFIRVFTVDPPTGKVKNFELYSGAQAFDEQFISLFPAEAGKLKKLLAYSAAMFHEIYGLKYAPSVLDILKMLFSCPKVLANMNKTFSQYLKLFDIHNPEIELLFQVFSGMCGLPNDRVAALLTVGVLYSLREKAGRPQGLFIDLTQQMEKRFRHLGGEIHLKCEVDRILIQNGAAQGVRLKDGTVIHAKNVISTADVKSTIQDLVGLDLVRAIKPGYARKLETVEMTTSAFIVNLGIDDDLLLSQHGLDCGYALLTSGVDAFSKLFRAFQNHETGLSKDCFYLGLACASPSGRRKPVLSIQAMPVPVGRWIQLRNTDRPQYLLEKERTADLLIDIVERYLVPGLRQHIVVKDISTPATLARYSGSPSGSIYDMASVPGNFGAHRLPVKTPIRGLLLPKFAHGAFGAMNSGLQAVDILLDGKVMHGNSRFKKQT